MWLKSIQMPDAYFLILNQPLVITITYLSSFKKIKLYTISTYGPLLGASKCCLYNLHNTSWIWTFYSKIKQHPLITITYLLNHHFSFLSRQSLIILLYTLCAGVHSCSKTFMRSTQSQTCTSPIFSSSYIRKKSFWMWFYLGTFLLEAMCESVFYFTIISFLHKNDPQNLTYTYMLVKTYNFPANLDTRTWTCCN